MFWNLIFIFINQKGFEPIVSMMNRVTLQCTVPNMTLKVTSKSTRFSVNIENF